MPDYNESKEEMETRRLGVLEIEERGTGRMIHAPEGYTLIIDGKSQDGDLKWCPDHGWEKVEDPGCWVWAYNAIARPYTDPFTDK